MPNATIPLAEAMRSLREEIRHAALDGQTEMLQFELGSIELEFTVVAKREGGPNAKIEFHVLGVGAELGADAKVGDERTQKVKMILNPVQIDSRTNERRQVAISRRK
jgi:Trypsin-co-occurring domain 2